MAAVVGAVTAALGVVNSMLGGRSAKRRAKRAREYQYYLMKKAYKANKKTFARNKALSEKWSTHWQDVADKPGKNNPYFQSFKEAVGEAATGTRQQVADSFRRAGRAGSGKLQQAMTDIGTASEKSLISTLAGIQKDATSKQQQAESMIGAEPYFGQEGTIPAMSNLNFKVSDYAPEMPDFTGLGEALAYLGRDKEEEVPGTYNYTYPQQQQEDDYWDIGWSDPVA